MKVKNVLRNSAVIGLVVLSLTGCTSKEEAVRRNAAGTKLVTIPTDIGDLTFENDFEHGVPTNETADKIFNEIDFQRASQAYIWAIPVVSFYSWMDTNDKLGAERGQMVYYEGYQGKLGGLTFNTITPYAGSFLDISKEPAVVVIPKGVPIRGAVHDMWQVGLTQITEPGTYVFVSEEQEIPDNIPEGAKVIKSKTNYVYPIARLMSQDYDERIKALKKIRFEKLDGTPISNKEPLIVKKGIDAKQPRGIEYFKVLNRAVQDNPLQERDKVMIDMLRTIGIEKGKEFNPDPKLTKMLTEASLVGEAMVKTINFKSHRLPQASYGPKGNTWDITTTSTPLQDRDGGLDLDGRAAWFYEAVTNDVAMHGMENGGWGQVYLSNYYDENKNGLNGSNHYTITLKNKNYAKLFWAITVYSIENRGIIENDVQRAEVGSDVKGTVYNEDGSVTFHFSPEKPAGINDANWIQTNKNENWFAYFRTYSPTKEFIEEDPEYIVPNFKLVK